MQYKALSLLQPWASLVVMGHKQIETRSFNTKYRGLLLIHSSLGKKREAIEAYNNFRFNGPLFRHEDFAGVSFNDLPFGAIIGCVSVVDCVRVESLSSGHYVTSKPNPNELALPRTLIHQAFLTEQERAFGDYSPGRFGWLLSEPVMLAEPIPCKGNLGIWNVPADTSLLVDQALATKSQ